jgi:hypothetical protein
VAGSSPAVATNSNIVTLVAINIVIIIFWNNMIKTGHIEYDNYALMQKCIELANNPIVSRKQEINDLFPGVINSHFKNIEFTKNTNVDPLFKSRESNPHKWTEFEFILSELKKHNPIETIETSWFNLMPYGGSMKPHCHTFSTQYVLVYYVNSTPEHPPIEVLVDGEWKQFNVVSGDWISFANDTHHRVGMNQTNVDRISISVNFNTRCSTMDSTRHS